MMFSWLQWVPEIKHHCPNTPFLIVGTKVDLRDDAETIEKLTENNQEVITREMGERFSRELKAVKYVECSAKTQVGSINFLALNFNILYTTTFIIVSQSYK